ncbi:MAG: META domain-containing protein [Erythrobacter sp.]
MTYRLAAAATLALLTGACATVPETQPLAGTKWQLAEIETGGSTTTLDPAIQRRHTLAFREGGELQAQLDCNRGRGTWTAGSAGTITFGPVMSTRMMCPQPSFGDRLAGGLAGVQRYTTAPGGKQLVLEGPDLRLTFTQATE